MWRLSRSIYWAFLAVAILAGLIYNGESVFAQGEIFQGEPSISVSGTGQIEIQPDVAVVRLGVESQAETASAALGQSSQQMQALMEALVQAGIAQEHIQTQVVQVQPIYDSSTEGQPQPIQPPTSNGDELVGYRATNLLQVRTEELDQLGELLDTAVQAGSNRIEGIQFEISEPARWLDQARSEAWAEAQRKAEQLAQLAGAELGRALQINESGAIIPVFAETARDVAAAAVPISPGTQTIQANLQVSWQLVYPRDSN